MWSKKSFVHNITQAVWILIMLGVFIYFSGFNGGPLYDLISGQAFKLGTFWLSLKYVFFGFVITFAVMFAGGIVIQKVLE